MIGFMSGLVRDTIPSYLQSVPIPRSFREFADLSAKEWIHLLAFSGTVGALSYYHVRDLCKKYQGIDTTLVNLKIKKSTAKVVDSIDVEDINEKVALCRCWRSEKFPYCDGSHAKHNTETGDNVGPAIVKRT